VFGPAIEDVVIHGLDPVEDARSPEPGEPQLEAEVAPDAIAQGARAHEQLPRARDQLGHHRPEAVGHERGVQVPLLHRKAVEQLAGHVDPPAAQVHRQVLPVVRELERGAEIVGERKERRVALAEDDEHQPADGVGREPAVAEQLAPRLVALLHRVLAEGGQQIEEQLFRDVEPAHRLAEGDEDRILGLAPIGGVEPVLPLVELLAAVPLVDRLIGEIVGGAGEAVERVDVGPLVPGDP